MQSETLQFDSQEMSYAEAVDTVGKLMADNSNFQVEESSNSSVPRTTFNSSMNTAMVTGRGNTTQIELEGTDTFVNSMMAQLNDNSTRPPSATTNNGIEQPSTRTQQNSTAPQRRRQQQRQQTTSYSQTIQEYDLDGEVEAHIDVMDDGSITVKTQEGENELDTALGLFIDKQGNVVMSYSDDLIDRSSLSVAQVLDSIENELRKIMG